jgi:kynurenine formamidase
MKFAHGLSGNVWGLSMFISMADHGGTHIDAPQHFGPRGISIDQYPRHAGAAALAGAWTLPRTNWMVLSNPSAIIAARALDHANRSAPDCVSFT